MGKLRGRLSSSLKFLYTFGHFAMDVLCCEGFKVLGIFSYDHVLRITLFLLHHSIIVFSRIRAIPLLSNSH